ncbi:glycoside hydrolase family 9 protein [Algibacillus agarilyticus]|uniref:glycoside hydrolase family 9 protein n=1 Tax=Algibacillus agarilyticus TaxID=2234133 RepID=UPI000DD09CC9|nr:glycoside hydrolase family 9 protein [Algibacillus agarilyticus]
MHTQSKLALFLSSCLFFTGCGSSGSASAPVDVNPSSPADGNTDVPTPPSTPDTSTPDAPSVSSDLIKLNQVGYLPLALKSALVPDVAATQFELINQNGAVAFTGALSAASHWQPSGSIKYKLADFSDFTATGVYRVKVAGIADSSAFSINSDLYQSLSDQALKAFYYNRSSHSILASHGGDWVRTAGHADTNVIVHASAATNERPAGSIISSSKGWYDAGDYGKYVVNSGIATYTLLAAYEHYDDFFTNRDINIPESGNTVPDILDEVKWNLDWLQTMQDNDGGVYHKLTTLGWPGIEMPAADQRARYVIGKSTAATLDFAAVLAQASRVYKPFYPELSAQWLTAAQNAWAWAVANPNVVYQQPSDVESGEYGDNFFQDEFRWAATELYITTANSQYLEAINRNATDISAPSWGYVAGLSYITLANQSKTDFDINAIDAAGHAIVGLAETYYQQYTDSAFLIPMIESDFVWGSNATALNKAIILLQAYQLTNEIKFKHAALGLADYILGRNPTGYSFVTGVGERSPLNIHHRVSAADTINAPIPGLLAGGPHNGQQDGCRYDSNAPALTYLDDWCSFSTNEVAINWNAPLVYVLAALAR